jgi:hypothetical protein
LIGQLAVSIEYRRLPCDGTDPDAVKCELAQGASSTAEFVGTACGDAHAARADAVVITAAQ